MWAVAENWKSLEPVNRICGANCSEGSPRCQNCRSPGVFKADAVLRAIPVAVTSYGWGGDEEKARAAGCDAYISKRQLLAKIREDLSLAAPTS
jgi:hypothetical protein